MTLPKHLSDCVETMRSEIHAANSTNWRLLHRNGRAWIDILLSDIEATPQIERAGNDAAAAIQRYADFIAMHLVLEPVEAELAKAGAYRALRTLEVAMADVRPSRRAAKLGIGW
jgi:hypothetical protein